MNLVISEVNKMINDIEFSTGTNIKDACEEMYDNILDGNVPQSTNFNGVRIIMFDDGNLRDDINE